MLQKLFKLLLFYIAFKLIGFIFYVVFIRTQWIPVANNAEENFAMKVFGLLLVAVFLFKNHWLKKQIRFAKTPQKKNILIIMAVLTPYILYELCTTIFYYRSFNIVPAQTSTLNIINTLLLAPVLEEVLYRGIIINYLLPTQQNKRWNVALCFLIISLLFAVMHNHFELYHFGGHIVFSLILSTIYYYQRNIYTVVLFHALYNLFVVIFNSSSIDLTTLPLAPEWFLFGAVLFMSLTIVVLFHFVRNKR